MNDSVSGNAKSIHIILACDVEAPFPAYTLRPYSIITMYYIIISFTAY